MISQIHATVRYQESSIVPIMVTSAICPIGDLHLGVVVVSCVVVTLVSAPPVAVFKGLVVSMGEARLPTVWAGVVAPDHMVGSALSVIGGALVVWATWCSSWYITGWAVLMVDRMASARRIERPGESSGTWRESVGGVQRWRSNTEMYTYTWYDVMAWKSFQHYWPFVRVSTGSPAHQKPINVKVSRCVCILASGGTILLLSVYRDPDGIKIDSVGTNRRKWRAVSSNVVF